MDYNILTLFIPFSLKRTSLGTLGKCPGKDWSTLLAVLELGLGLIVDTVPLGWRNSSCSQHETLC